MHTRNYTEGKSSDNKVVIMKRILKNYAVGRMAAPKLHLPKAFNRVLKNAVLGAALTAIHQKGNDFSEDYERMVQNGIIPNNVRYTTRIYVLNTCFYEFYYTFPHVSTSIVR